MASSAPESHSAKEPSHSMWRSGVETCRSGPLGEQHRGPVQDQDSVDGSLAGGIASCVTTAHTLDCSQRRWRKRFPHPQAPPPSERSSGPQRKAIFAPDPNPARESSHGRQ